MAVQEVARYLGLSEKQFLRVAALRAVQQVTAEVRAQAKKQDEAKLANPEGVQDGRESSNIQLEPASAEGQSSQVVDTTTPAE